MLNPTLSMLIKIRDACNASRKWAGASIMRSQFKARPDDLFICSYPRSGSELLQNMAYQLLGDGSMDIPHIKMKVPNLELDISGRRNIESIKSPRLFKTTLPYKYIPNQPDSRFIYITRNGMDVALSYYNYYREYKHYEDGFDTFFSLFLKGQLDGGSWFKHTREWLKNNQDRNILHLRFEDAAASPLETAALILAFCGKKTHSSQLSPLENRLSIEFINQHAHLFDRRKRVGSSGFLHKGRSGQGREIFNQRQKHTYLQMLEKHRLPQEIYGVPTTVES